MILPEAHDILLGHMMMQEMVKLVTNFVQELSGKKTIANVACAVEKLAIVRPLVLGLVSADNLVNVVKVTRTKIDLFKTFLLGRGLYKHCLGSWNTNIGG
jgi:hypothetical protein